MSFELAKEILGYARAELERALKTGDMLLYRNAADKAFSALVVAVNAYVKAIEGVEVPGGARFEVAENLREDVDLIIGRPEIDAWDITFTPEGPRPRKVPIEFEVI
jgi:hypothetical protein